MYLANVENQERHTSLLPAVFAESWCQAIFPKTLKTNTTCVQSQSAKVIKSKFWEVTSNLVKEKSWLFTADADAFTLRKSPGISKTNNQFRFQFIPVTVSSPHSSLTKTVNASSKRRSAHYPAKTSTSKWARWIERSGSPFESVRYIYMTFSLDFKLKLAESWPWVLSVSACQEAS